MFQNDELKEHLESSFSVESEPAAIAEWNMNIPGNIQTLGNYRYRKNDTRLNVLPNIFDPNVFGNFYPGATESDITFESGVEQGGSTTQLLTSRKDDISFKISIRLLFLNLKPIKSDSIEKGERKLE